MLKEKHVLLGKEIDCKKALPKEKAPPREKPSKNIYNPNRIFIGGIPKKTTEIELKEYFSKYGKIEECLMIMNKNSKRYRGFGFVTFEHYESVDLVFKDYQGHFIKGAWIECKASFPKNLNMDQDDCTHPDLGDFNLDRIYEDDDSSLCDESQTLGGQPLTPSLPVSSQNLQATSHLTHHTVSNSANQIPEFSPPSNNHKFPQANQNGCQNNNTMSNPNINNVSIEMDISSSKLTNNNNQQSNDKTCPYLKKDFSE